MERKTLPEVDSAACRASILLESYYVWTGKGSPETGTGNFRRSYRKLFSKLKIEDGHPHRFRDTFAVEQLLSGTPIEEVSALLGHTSIKTTEESSAPWAHSRQKKLETSAKKSWADDPILKLLEGTPGVYKKLS